MGQAHVIRHKVFIEGRSIRRVAREMMISRNTVRKYLAQSEPKRIELQPRERPVLEKVKSRIDELLNAWVPRTTAKQRITGSRIHEQLLFEGYSVGVTTVRDYLAELKRVKREVFVPLLYLPGQVAQVDFFEVTVEIDGTRQKTWQFVVHLPYSGKDFACIYERCNQVAFLDGHVRAFQHFGGVPARIVYDNLTAAVKRRLGMTIELTDRFRALASHYLFEPCFARPGEGHDKGSVEARGKGIRLRHLTPIPQERTLTALNERLLANLEATTGSRKDRMGRTVKERFEEERPLLRPLPPRPFEARQVVPLVVDRQAMVRIEGAEYSLPSPWASLQIMGFVGVADIRFECRSESLVVPKVPRGGRLVSYRHYLKELARKPQAVRQVAPKLLAELGAPYQGLWEMLCPRYGELEAARVVAKLLGAIDHEGEGRISQALQEFVSSMSETITSVFRDILTVCYSEGLIGRSMFAVDGCKIASNCAKEWSGTKKELKKKAEKIEASVRVLVERHRTSDSRFLEPGQEQKEQRAIEHLQSKAAKIRGWLQDNPERIGSRGKPIKSNLTDPDSAKMVSSHGVIQGYNGIAVVDDRRQVILDAQAFGDGHEAAHLSEVLDSLQQTFVAIDASPDALHKVVLTADSGFHSEQSVKMLLERGLDAYVADNRFRLRDPRFASLQKHRSKTTDSAHTSRARKYFRPADFVFDESGTLLCPAGHPMKCTCRTYRSNNGFHGQLYKADAAHCTACPLRSRCMRVSHTPARQVVKLEKAIRHDGENFTQRMIERFDSSRGRHYYSRRMGAVEPVFANIRSTMGLDWFSLRGKRKVDTQWKLFCIAHNIGKLARYGRWAKN